MKVKKTKFKLKTDYTQIPPLRDALFEFSRSYSSMGSDYSVTALIKPARVIMLERRYAAYLDQLPVDHDYIEKLLASFRGSAIHSYFEWMLRKHFNKNPDKKYVIEYRLWDKLAGRRISGKPDVLLDKTLYDFKTTSVWKKIFGDWEDYIAQLNIYDYLFSAVGREVDYLTIIAWYQDWEKWKIHEKGYPKTQVEEIPIYDKWGKTKQEDYVIDRIECMKRNEDLPDEQLDPCTEKEMWTKDSVYKVYKVRSSDPDQLPPKSSRNLETQEKAEAWVKKMAHKLPKGVEYKIVHVPGARTRCEEYCRINMFCNIYHAYMDQKEKESADEK